MLIIFKWNYLTRGQITKLLQLQIRVNLGAMAMKEEPHHKMQFSVVTRIPFWEGSVLQSLYSKLF